MQEDVTILAQFYKLVVWFENNRKEAAIGAGVIAVVALGLGYYFWNQGEKETSAGEALAQVVVQSSLNPGAPESVAEGFEKVASDFAGTRAAGQALLQAGTALFQETKYDDAQARFQEVIQRYPESQILPQAQFGVAACLDAQGKADEALAAYQRVISGYPNSNVIAQSKYAAARILESQGKLADAGNLYEDIVKVYGLNNSIGSEAGIRGDEVKRRMTLSGSAPVEPASVTPSFSASDFTRSLTNMMGAKPTNTP